MIEARDDFNMTARMRQLGATLNQMMAAMSESRWNYYLSYVTDGACPLIFFFVGMRSHVSSPKIVLGTLAGAVLFTLVEYAIHRWLLHDPRSILFPLHATHHNAPTEPSAFLFPASVVVLGIVWLFFVPLLHLPSAAFVIAGFAATYFYYGLLHHFEHSIKANRLPFRWMQKRWAAHTVHHHLDHTNFGVMTSFWDYVFQTHHKQAKRRQQRQA